MNSSVPAVTLNLNAISGQSSIEQKLEQARLVAYQLPNGELIGHADWLYNLQGNPQLPHLSTEVKWQIYHAAYAYKDLFGVIHLNDNFFIEYLDAKDLAMLYKIIVSYHKHEVGAKGEQNTISHAHRDLIEKTFVTLCQTNVMEGRKVLEELKAINNITLNPIIYKLQKILDKAKTHTPPGDVVQNKLLEARAQAGGLPSGKLIWFADCFYNLCDNPLYPILSDSVKWQIVHAAYSYKDKDKVIHMSDNFSIEALSYSDLAVLYRVFLAYHTLEKKEKGEENAIFQKHLFLLEARFESACFGNPFEGYEAIRTLEQIGDPSFAPLLQSLRKTQEKKGGYPVFVEDPVVATLCTFLQPAEIRGFLSSQGLAKTREIFGHLQTNWSRFFTWLDEFSIVEAVEGDPTIKKVALRWKSRVEEHLFLRYMDLITRIGESYPELLGDKFSLSHQLALRPQGMSLMVEHFKAKGSFVGTTCICDNYEVYKQGLKNISYLPDGEWYFIIRTHKVHWTFDSDHEALVFVEKREGEFFVHIYDSGPFKMFLAGHQLTDETKSVLPQAHIYATLVPRQRDFFNCGVYALKDMKALSRNKDALIQWQRANAERAEKHLPQDAPLSIRDVLVTKEAPLDFLKPVQSISQLKSALANPSVPDHLGKRDKIRELMRIFHVLELSEDQSNFGSPVYAYTKLKGLKYRIRILNETFNRIASLT